MAKQKETSLARVENDWRKKEHHPPASSKNTISRPQKMVQDALKDLSGGTIKEMMEAEMDDHLDMRNPSVLTMTFGQRL